MSEDFQDALRQDHQGESLVPERNRGQAGVRPRKVSLTHGAESRKERIARGAKLNAGGNQTLISVSGSPTAKHEQHLNRIDCEKEVPDCAGSNDGDIQRGRDAVHV